MDYTFLDLVQMVARESGTIADELPQTVSGQTGRIGKIVHWVNLAWNVIQNHHASWQWMHDTFEGDIEPEMHRYSHIQMGIQRFGRWSTLPYTVSIYDKEIGKADESFIHPIPYRDYRRIYDIGDTHTGRPACFSIDPSNLILVGPVPDKEYRIRGEYYKSAQVLVNDADLPELPVRFRPIIGWFALVLLSKHDEAGFAVSAAAQNYQQYLSNLEIDQLQSVRLSYRHSGCLI